MELKLPETLPCAAELQAARLEKDSDEFASCHSLEPYIPAVSRLLREASSRGERGVVIKFMVADYADEAICGQAITQMGRLLESRGFQYCVSYDTYALSLSAGEVSVSPMRNPEIIAMTVMWP